MTIEQDGDVRREEARPASRMRVAAFDGVSLQFQPSNSNFSSSIILLWRFYDLLDLLVLVPGQK